MPIRSGMTRWIIWPSVSSVCRSSPVRPLQELASAFGEIDALAELEGVVVGDDDLGLLHVFQHVVRDEFAAGVVAVGVVRLEDAKAVLDGQTRAPR